MVESASDLTGYLRLGTVEKARFRQELTSARQQFFGELRRQLGKKSEACSLLGESQFAVLFLMVQRET